MATKITLPSQYQNEVLDHQLLWTKRLGTDTIATSAFVVLSPSTMTTSSPAPTNTTTTTKVWLTGGVLGSTNYIRNTITTVAGRTMSAVLAVKVAKP